MTARIVGIGAYAPETIVTNHDLAKIGFNRPDFEQNPLEANLKAIHEELAKARTIAPEGVLGFNIMVATKEYQQYVREAVKAGADVIISGAGLLIDLPKLVSEAEKAIMDERRTMLAPIVSSAKSAQVICRMWDRKYKTVPDFVVIEGPCAGGHLGFSKEQLTELGVDTDCVSKTYKQNKYEDEIREIMKIVKEFAEKYNKEIPIIVAGRAIKNKFQERVQEGRIPVKKCFGCLEHCNPAETPYCITRALIHAAIGNIDDALLFCGSNAYRSKTIEIVPNVMKELCGY